MICYEGISVWGDMLTSVADCHEITKGRFLGQSLTDANILTVTDSNLTKLFEPKFWGP